MSIKNDAKEIKEEFQKDDVPLLAAAQAYHYLLSIIPMLILLLSIVPYLNISSSQIMRFISEVLPDETSSIFKDSIVSVVKTPSGGLLTIGILGTIWSASNGIHAFIKASNQAYEVEENRSFLKVRLISIALTFGMIIALVVSIVLPVFGQVILKMVNVFIPMPEHIKLILSILRWVISIIVITSILIVLYRFAPNKTLPVKEILPGACLASILWLLISLSFSFYVSNFGNYSATYGSLGGIIVMMIWFFLTGLILMIGAEINVVNHRKKRQQSQTSQQGEMNVTH
ncbi:YihY/virulence factor BrkB family protein [Pseudalkalibacillus salsuginis]|uniref:YihY/virulence factor BrkB family protein n=1 Tax=Pseudalkalibacillus salsuginis TaxID=2910972 RepID=UPI001F234C51|nr:YihY/virulence factor BrkB family protein [Pseudalkalibacillus salsuginis]MCF6408163.1 YihY/virulence factor BrkB family protein [Pseudalkalibacillus salsuginis]